MTKTNWTPTLAWLGAVTAALLLAMAAPSESNFMGRLPTLTVKRLDQQRVVLPQGLQSERTLALVGFDRRHSSEIQSWIRGLRLDQDSSIAWFKMPVLNDPGTEQGRNHLENIRSRLVPVFTNRDAFLRAAGLSGMDHAWVLVLNRDGKVLARAEGEYDPDKALALRETLLAQGD